MKVKKSIKHLLVELISAVFVLLFVYAALSKILDFEKFRVELGKSPILNAFTYYVSVGIPLLEILIAMLLTLKKFQHIALYASFTMMVMFSAYIVAILNFSSYIPCTCGGILEKMNWTQHLIFNMVFIILGIIGVLIYPDERPYLQ